MTPPPSSRHRPKFQRPLRLCGLGLVAVIACTREAPEAPAPDSGPIGPLRGDELGLVRGPGTPAPDSAPVAAIRARCEGASVLLITMDTLRADHLGRVVAGSSITPNLDRIAAEGVDFERALSTAPVTLPSHTSMMTGLVPSEHGALENGTFVAHESLTTLAERLRDEGYSTAAFVSSHVLSRGYGLDQGFEHFDDRLETRPQRPALERSARGTVDAVQEWLREPPPEPWFLWVHFYDPHSPYEAPPEYRGGRSPYAAEVAFMDDQIGRLREVYDREGRLDRTLLIATSDHGEGLGEHGEPTHGLLLYDTTLHVPLLLRHPALPGGRTVRGQVSLTDLAPTVLDLLSLPFEARACSVSLLPTLAAPRPEIWHDAFAETALPQFMFRGAAIDALMTRDHKSIRAPRPELYDLRADPREAEDLSARQPALSRELLARTRRLQADFALRAPRSERSLSDEELEQLRLLGYRVESDNLHVQYEGMDPKDLIVLAQRQIVAQEALVAGRDQEALRRFDELLREVPDDATNLAGRGFALLALGREEDGREALEQALDLRPDFFMAALTLAQQARRQGRLADAIKWCDRAIAHNPALVEAYLLGSEACFQKGDLVRARDLVTRALRDTDPTPEQDAMLRRRLASLEGQGD